MVYYNPHITEQYNPPYSLHNQGFFIAQFNYTLENKHGTQWWRFGSNDFPLQTGDF